jgi:hypothetical protein
MKRGDWNTQLRSTVELTSTTEEFRMKESLTASEAGKVVFEQTWDRHIKRDLM